jgi:D-alanine--poly(phosphoribitol) ligase subunit 1
MPLNTVKYLRHKLPHALLSNLYGPTETTVAAMYWICGDDLDSLDSIPLGRPCENTRIIFLDEDNRPVVDDDVVAEICIGGIGVALGYWNDPEKTAAVFIQNPQQPYFRDIIYKTGDYGYRSSKDGLIYFVGRRDHQIKHSGYRIELGEIEAAMNTISEVQQSCALYDSVAKRIVVFYVSSPNGPLPQLRERLRALLPAYMLPHVFHRLEVFPVTANGKIDRSRLMTMTA